jgi:predicted  nucleic acid-binding Zn-ribbon protein
MTHTDPRRGLTEHDGSEQQLRDTKRLLAKALHRIRMLQEKGADQKQQVRELQARAKHEDNLAARCQELSDEIADLKGEIKELTRANREQVERIDVFRAEIVRLKLRTVTAAANVSSLHFSG